MDTLLHIFTVLILIVTVYSYVQFARGKDSPLEKVYRDDDEFKRYQAERRKDNEQP